MSMYIIQKYVLSQFIFLENSISRHISSTSQFISHQNIIVCVFTQGNNNHLFEIIFNTNNK